MREQTCIGVGRHEKKSLFSEEIILWPKKQSTYNFITTFCVVRSYQSPSIWKNSALDNEGENSKLKILVNFMSAIFL